MPNVWIIVEGELREGYHLADGKVYLDFDDATRACEQYVASRNESGHSYKWDAKRNRYTDECDYIALRQMDLVRSVRA